MTIESSEFLAELRKLATTCDPKCLELASLVNLVTLMLDGMDVPGVSSYVQNYRRVFEGMLNNHIQAENIDLCEFAKAFESLTATIATVMTLNAIPSDAAVEAEIKGKKQ